MPPGASFIPQVKLEGGGTRSYEREGIPAICNNMGET